MRNYTKTSIIWSLFILEVGVTSLTKQMTVTATPFSERQKILFWVSKVINATFLYEFSAVSAHTLHDICLA